MAVPDASIIVPTRNRSRLLATALRSVLRQEGVEFEVIVADDASTDDTVALCEQLRDPRVRVVSNPAPQGPNAARNRGADEARGAWLAFIDDDDVWAPGKLARQIAAATAAQRDWVYAGSVNVNDDLQVIHGIPPLPPEEVAAALPRYNAIPASASNVIVRRALFASADGFNEALRACEEWDLWLRLLTAGPPAWVRAPLVGYRMHAGNSSLDVAAIMAGARQIEQLHHVAIDWGRFHWWVAQLCVRDGRRAEALRQYVHAMRRGYGAQARADLSQLARRRFRGRADATSGPSARRADSSWEEEAGGWLATLRTLEESVHQ